MSHPVPPHQPRPRLRSVHPPPSWKRTLRRESAATIRVASARYPGIVRCAPGEGSHPPPPVPPSSPAGSHSRKGDLPTQTVQFLWRGRKNARGLQLLGRSERCLPEDRHAPHGEVQAGEPEEPSTVRMLWRAGTSASGAQLRRWRLPPVPSWWPEPGEHEDVYAAAAEWSDNESECSSEATTFQGDDFADARADRDGLRVRFRGRSEGQPEQGELAKNRRQTAGQDRMP